MHFHKKKVELLHNWKLFELTTPTYPNQKETRKNKHSSYDVAHYFDNHIKQIV